jgi:tetratricopeptide (TPR) repeat protein
MGRKRTQPGKYLHFLAASLIFLSLPGCGTLERTKIQVEEQIASPEKRKEKVKEEAPVAPDAQEVPNRKKPAESAETTEYILRGKKLLAVRDYEGSLREFQKALDLSPDTSSGDEALFHTGLIYAHPGNPQKDYGKSLGLFKRLVKDYPQSIWYEQAKAWIGALQEIERLNQVIEKSKQVDIEVEEKKREKTK